MGIYFSSADELYKRLTPALRLKVREFKKSHIRMISEEDVWLYLKNRIWKNKVDLSLAEMVNDILNVKSIDVLEYRSFNSTEVI